MIFDQNQKPKSSLNEVTFSWKVLEASTEPAGILGADSRAEPGYLAWKVCGFFFFFLPQTKAGQGYFIYVYLEV